MRGLDKNRWWQHNHKISSCFWYSLPSSLAKRPKLTYCRNVRSLFQLFGNAWPLLAESKTVSSTSTSAVETAVWGRQLFLHGQRTVCKKSLLRHSHVSVETEAEKDFDAPSVTRGVPSRAGTRGRLPSSSSLPNLALLNHRPKAIVWPSAASPIWLMSTQQS